jgi:hypothetical protein
MRAQRRMYRCVASICLAGNISLVILQFHAIPSIRRHRRSHLEGESFWWLLKHGISVLLRVDRRIALLAWVYLTLVCSFRCVRPQFEAHLCSQGLRSLGTSSCRTYILFSILGISLVFTLRSLFDPTLLLFSSSFRVGRHLINERLDVPFQHVACMSPKSSGRCDNPLHVWSDCGYLVLFTTCHHSNRRQCPDLDCAGIPQVYTLRFSISALIDSTL